MPSFDTKLAQALDGIDARSQRRHLVPAEVAGPGRVRREGAELVDFSSNDYLGLSQHPAVIEGARAYAARYGAGAGASRLVTGTRDHHLALEVRMAAWKHTEAALFLASGWQANAAVLPALLAVAQTPLVFADRLNHASLHQGCLAANVRQIRFRHNDLDHLETLLADRGGMPGDRFIVTESVFSMDGDRADVARLADIARRHDAFLYLDEAHATGVLGPGGAGLSALAPGGVDLIMGTFSKAFGSFGAYVAGSRLLCDYLTNACGGFIYTTALPPPVLGAIHAALDLLPHMDSERARLAGMGDHVRAGLTTAGYDVARSSTQIVPAIVGSADEALALSARLRTAGLLAAAIRPPTVPPGTSRLRLALSASHTDSDIERLLEVLRSDRSAG